MAVSVKLTYLGMVAGKTDIHRFRHQFWNGAPNKYPSWNYEGNFMSIVCNNREVWKDGPVTFGESDYPYSGGDRTAWSREVEIHLPAGTTNSLYAKTADLRNEYPQYLATSGTIQVLAGFLDSVSCPNAYHDRAKLIFRCRTPYHEDLMWDNNRDGQWGTKRLPTNNNTYTESCEVRLRPNSAFNARVGLIPDGHGGNAGWLHPPVTHRVATTYTNMKNATIRVERTPNDPDNIVISWTSTSESNYPSGPGVRRSDTLILRDNKNNNIKVWYVDFRNAGSVTYRHADDCRVIAEYCTVGLVDSGGTKKDYYQTFFNKEVGNSMMVFVKVNGEYKSVKAIYVKINGRYKLMKNLKVKVLGKYKSVV